jgi:hypothetical protein
MDHLLSKAGLGRRYRSYCQQFLNVIAAWSLFVHQFFKFLAFPPNSFDLPRKTSEFHHLLMADLFL